MRHYIGMIKRSWCMTLMIIFCTIFCIIMGLYAGTKVLSHFIYIPITLATIWWGNKGISVAAFFGIMLIILSLTLENAPTLSHSVLMAVTFIIVGYLVGKLSGERDLERALSRLKDKVIRDNNKNKK